MKIPDSKQIMRDGENIIGLTTNLILEEPEPSQRTVISKENLENVLKLIKVFGWEEIAIRVQKDYPIILSEPEPSKQELKGIMIAPRIEE